MRHDAGRRRLVPWVPPPAGRRAPPGSPRRRPPRPRLPSPSSPGPRCAGGAAQPECWHPRVPGTSRWKERPVTAPEGELADPEQRAAAVRRLEPTALGSRALQRLTALAARLVAADAAAVSLLGDVETVVSGFG